MWEKLRLSLIAMARNPEAALGGQLGDSLAELGSSLQHDPALQWQVNRFARRTLVGVVTRYGARSSGWCPRPCAAGTRRR